MPPLPTCLTRSGTDRVQVTTWGPHRQLFAALFSGHGSGSGCSEFVLSHMKDTVEAFLAGDAAARAAVADALQFGPGSLLRRALPDPAAVPGRVFAAEELRAYDGNHARTEGKVYLAVCGLVYDMSAGAKYYGPGGAYGTLAGHDATLCLAKHSLAPALRDAPWSVEQGAAAPLSPEEEGTLANFLKTFAKYPIVGRLALCAGGSST